MTVSPSIHVYKPGEYDKPRSKSLVTRLAGVSEDWIRHEFKVPEKGWPSSVTVVLTIESESLRDNPFLWDAIRVLVSSSDTPIGLSELHETSSGFRFNPPGDSAADSGQFFYLLPWEASVVISISRVVPKGRPRALISIKEPSKKGSGKAFTIWEGEAFKTLPDGLYGARVVYTRLNAPETKPLWLWIPFTLERNIK